MDIYANVIELGNL